MSSGKKFLSTTRGRILGMLRDARRTVGEMARTLHITENGVRSHLSVLEEEGLIRPSGRIQGKRKPFHAYELTDEGERLFPKSYGALLAELLDVLAGSLTEDELVRACEETGSRLAAKLAPECDRLIFAKRVALSLEVLASMGGAATLAENDGAFEIEGSSCPIAEAVEGSPHACAIAQSLLGRITGGEVTECCDRSGKPKCRFTIRAA